MAKASSLVLAVGVLVLGAAGTSWARDVDKPVKPVPVYTHEFEKPIGPEWSPARTFSIRQHKGKVLGQFTNEKVVLKLKDLPKHAYLQIRFLLVVTGTWQGQGTTGSAGQGEPWRLRMVDGPMLLHTTFAYSRRAGINPLAGAKVRQAFPDWYPEGNHPIMTGSTGMGPQFGLFRVACLFPHTASELALEFSGPDAGAVRGNKGWALDSVIVEAFTGPPGKGLDDAALEQLWADLADSEPMRTARAVRSLIGVGDRAAAMLARKIAESLKSPENPEIAKLIVKLDDVRWMTREKATQQLIGIGLPAQATLRQALAANPSAEARSRIERILARLEAAQSQSPETLRWARAARILQMIGSDAAKPVLKTLAEKAPNQLTRELARQALGEERPSTEATKAQGRAAAARLPVVLPAR